MKFIDDLYSETKEIFNKYKDKNVPGSIIFYGPVYKNPDLMIIGENPGGVEEKVQEKPEKEHDYKIYDYRMARQMKKIFVGHHDALFSSVKFNRIFFRSRNLSAFYKNPNWKDLQEYSHNKTIEIIDELKPKKIVTEGFGTFRALNEEQNEKIMLRGNHKNLMLWGYHNEIELIGLTHPTSTRGLSDEEILQMNDVIKDVIDPNVILIDSESYYLSCVTLEELSLGGYTTEDLDFSSRFNVAKKFIEKLISLLKSNGNAKIRMVGGQDLIKQKADIDSFNIALRSIDAKLKNPNKEIISDKMIIPSLNVVSGMFNHSYLSELTVKN